MNKKILIVEDDEGIRAQIIDKVVMDLLCLTKLIEKLLSLVRVERIEYGSNNQQRSDAEWKVGTEMCFQNAFVSGCPKKAFS